MVKALLDSSGAPADGRETEEVLVKQAREGDPLAFTRLYERHYDRIYRHAYKQVGRGPDAEDLAQQVFVQAWRAIGRYRATGSPFLAWLYTITHNTVISYRRRARSEYSLESDLREWPSPEQLERSVETKVECERVQESLCHLRQKDQQVVTMRLMEGLAYEEIAASLGVSLSTVRVIQHRALRHLRQILASQSR